jgi:hypothetical protein
MMTPYSWEVQISPYIKLGKYCGSCHLFTLEIIVLCIPTLRHLILSLIEH